MKKSQSKEFDLPSKLWDRYEELATGVDGADVVTTLKQAGEEIWAAGLDKMYTEMSPKAQRREPVRQVFTVTYLTIACVKLEELKRGKKPKTRIKG